LLSEQHLYGSSRLGMYTQEEAEMIGASAPVATGYFELIRGDKNYELSNHLGNVLSVISDRKIAVDDEGDVAYYISDVRSYSDYYPFGAPMDGRTWSGHYRFGFNGKELDAEGMGGGSSTYDYGFRIYNAALGKFLSVDPLYKDFPWYSPYQFAGDKPIWAIDLDGLEEYYVTDYYDAAGGLYKTEIKLVSSFGMHTDGRQDQQIVHRSRIDVSPAAGTFSKVFLGSSIGTATGNNAFATNIERQFATGINANGSAFAVFDASNKVLSIATTNSDGTQTRRSATAATYALIPVAYSNIKASFKEAYYDSNGISIGLETVNIGRDKSPIVSMEIDSTIDAVTYTGTDPGVRIMSGTNAVPPDPYQRGTNGPIGSANDDAQGGSGTISPIR